jgi:hypothetical protein
MKKFNEKAWVAQELAKFTAENYVELRRSHQFLVAALGADIATGQATLIEKADALFGDVK